VSRAFEPYKLAEIPNAADAVFKASDLFHVIDEKIKDIQAQGRNSTSMSQDEIVGRHYMVRALTVLREEIDAQIEIAARRANAERYSNQFTQVDPHWRNH
jgi:hypothetical protein